MIVGAGDENSIEIAKIKVVVYMKIKIQRGRNSLQNNVVS